MAAKPFTLPEVRWTYRRWYTYALTLISVALVGCVILRLTDQRALMWVALALCLERALLALSYLNGATTTDVAKIAAAARGQAAGDDA